MNELTVNWEQKRPTKSQILDFWSNTKFEKIDKWSKTADVFAEKIRETHVNGGIQLHKYRIKNNEYFNWFASRNRLCEIDFVQQTLWHKTLKNYINDLEIKGKPEINLIEDFTDMYDLAGQLARILGQGGAHKKLNQKEAWNIATDFIESEFENRFKEVLLFNFTIRNAKWFYNMTWDYSFMLFDKRYNIVTIIDITDTD